MTVEDRASWAVVDDAFVRIMGAVVPRPLHTPFTDSIDAALRQLFGDLVGLMDYRLASGLPCHQELKRVIDAIAET